MVPEHAAGPGELQNALNGIRNVCEDQLDAELLGPLADREKSADAGGVDESDVGEIQGEPTDPLSDQQPIHLGLEIEGRGHVQLAGERDFDNCVVDPWRPGRGGVK